MHLAKMASCLGGAVLAILAWVVAYIDQYSLANYGFSPGCTGFILLAGFVTSAMQKVSRLPAGCRPSTLSAGAMPCDACSWVRLLRC